MGALAALLLGDARLPVGGHTQSAGFEAAVLAGLEVADVRAYLAMRLATVARVEAATSVVGLAYLRRGDGLESVFAHWAARTPSRVQRDASAQAARGYLRLAERLAPGRPRSAVPAARPLALAFLADIVGLTQLELATVVVHDEIQSVTSAALKLLPVDPAWTVEWAIAAHEDAGRVIDEVTGMTEPADIPCPAASLSEVWIDRHAHTQRRLFHA